MFSGLLAGILFGCGGSLSKEQQKELIEAKNAQAIKRVTEAQILEKASEEGRRLVSLADSLKEYSLDSLADANHVVIKYLKPDATNAIDIERQIIGAYLSVAEENLPENVQKLGEDSIIYSKPVVKKLPDGVIEVKGVWSVILSKKQIVLSI